MKKRNLKSLSLNKKSVSNLDNSGLVGGTFITHALNCPSALVKPYCLVKKTEFWSCDHCGN